MSFYSRIKKLERTSDANSCTCRRLGQYVAIPSNLTIEEKTAIIDAQAPAPCPIHGAAAIVPIPVEQRDSDHLYQVAGEHAVAATLAE